MSSSKKTTSNSATAGTTNLVQTPTNPAFVSQGLGQLGTQATGLAAQDPYSFVADPNKSLLQAQGGATALTNPQGFADAQTALKTGTGAQGQSLLTGLDSYFSPFQKNVVDTTLAGFDHNAGYTRAQDTLARAGDTTFGGSGGAIQSALNEQNIARDRASTQATLENQGFTTAAGLSNMDAQRRQDAISQQIAAAQGLSGNAAAQGANAQSNVAAQSSIGQILQQIAQARASAPINSLGSISSIFSSLPLNLLHGTDAAGAENSTTNGTSTTKSSDPLGSIGSLLGGLGAFGFKPFGLGALPATTNI